MSVLQSLIDRLREALGEERPQLWTTTLDQEAAPALKGRRSQGRCIEPMLNDLMRDSRDRELPLGCVPLILQRDGKEHRLPCLDTALREGDQILFCGSRQARTTLHAILRNPYTLEYLVSGEEPPRSYLVRYLQKRYRHASRQAH